MEYTLNEIAGMLEAPESTVRLYRDEFEEYLPVSGQGRRRRYSRESLVLFRQIIARKQEGWTASAIREELGRLTQPGPRARRRTAETQLDEIVALIRAQGAEIALLRAEVGQLREEVAASARASSGNDAPTLEELQRAHLRAGA